MNVKILFQDNYENIEMQRILTVSITPVSGASINFLYPADGPELAETADFTFAVA